MAKPITITILGDSSKLDGALSETSAKIEASFSGIAGRAHAIFQGIGQAVGQQLAQIPGQVAGFLKGSIGAASDLNESMSKAQVVFGDSAKSIEDWSSKSAEALGQSRQQALEAAGTYGNLFQAFGLGQAQSADMSKSLVQLAADLASFNNTSPDEALQALRSGLSGETEPLKRFGIAINEDRLKAEAFRLGLVKAEVDTQKLSQAQEVADKAARKQAEALKKHGANSVEYADAVRDAEQANDKLAAVMEGKVPTSLTAAQKAQASYSLIMQDTKLAQGDFARTSDGLANKQRILSAQWTDLKAKIGDHLLPVVSQLAGAISSKLFPALSVWGGKLQDLAARGKPVVDWFKDHWPQIVDAVQSAVEKVRRVATEVWSYIYDRVRTAVDNTVEFVRRNWDTIRGIIVGTFQGVFDALSAVLPQIIDAIAGVFNFVNDHREILVGLAVVVGGYLVGAFVAWAASALAAAVSTALAAAPVILLGAAIAGLVAGVIWAYKNVDIFREVVDTAADILLHVVWPVLRTVAEYLVSSFVGAFQTAMTVVRGLWEFFQTLYGVASGVFSGVRDAIETTVGVIAGLPGRIKNVTVGMFDGIKDAFKAAINWIIDGWNGIRFTIPEIDTHIPGIGKVGGWSVGVPAIQRLAMGGTATGGLTLVGERGPELLALPRGAHVTPFAGASGSTINVYAETTANPDDIARAVAWAIKTSGR